VGKDRLRSGMGGYWRLMGWAVGDYRLMIYIYQGMSGADKGLLSSVRQRVKENATHEGIS